MKEKRSLNRKKPQDLRTRLSEGPPSVEGQGKEKRAERGQKTHYEIKELMNKCSSFVFIIFILFHMEHFTKKEGSTFVLTDVWIKDKIRHHIRLSVYDEKRF